MFFNKAKIDDIYNVQISIKFTLPLTALPIGDASLTHVIKLAAHSTKPPTPTAMRQSFIMTRICIKFFFLNLASKLALESQLRTHRSYKSVRFKQLIRDP
jgi:hypothetical protein